MKSIHSFLSIFWSISSGVTIAVSLFPKADIKFVKLALLGVAMVFFSFISYLQICFSLFYISIDQLASTLTMPLFQSFPPEVTSLFVLLFSAL